MAPSLSPDKAPRRFRRLPMRPGSASRVKKMAVSVTSDEKRKVERVAKEIYDASPSEVLFFKSVDQLVRAHDEVYGTETPNR